MSAPYFISYVKGSASVAFYNFCKYKHLKGNSKTDSNTLKICVIINSLQICVQ